MTRYQRFQYYRLAAGSMMLSYGASGLLDWKLGRSQYVQLRNAQLEGRGTTGGEGANHPSSSLVQGLHIGFQTDGQTQVMGTVAGSLNL